MIKIENVNIWVKLVKQNRAAGMGMIESVEQVVESQNLTGRERIALIMNVPSTRK